MKNYLHHKIYNAINIKGLTALEFLDFEGKYKDYSESHAFWEICFVKEGEISLSVKGKDISISKDQLFIIPPNYTHCYKDKSTNSTVFVICFESVSDVLKSLSMVSFNLSYDQIYCLDKIIQENKNTFSMNDNDLLEVINSPVFGGKQAIILQLEYLLILLARQNINHNSNKIVLLGEETFYEDLINLVISFLKENINKKLSLNEICKNLHCSRSFLCRIFKEQTGQTTIAYFNSLKVEEAKNMLIDTEMTISEISSALGFNEVKYFHFFFKKNLGVTPTDFRNKERKR